MCTRAVAAALKVLLREAKRLPTEGFVFVTSKNGGEALNCYARAFQINGFRLEGKWPRVEKSGYVATMLMFVHDKKRKTTS